MITKQEIQVCLCDVCGEVADGNYHTTSYLNGDVCAETSCPIDLCKKHMNIWANNMRHTERERYDDKISEEERNKLIKEIKDHSYWAV